MFALLGFISYGIFECLQQRKEEKELEKLTIISRLCVLLYALESAYLENLRFEDIDPKYLEEEWSSHLIDILTYHVAVGNITSADLAVGATVDMFNMESANITSLDPPVINEADIDAVDLFADNGVVHVIDEVLLPSSALNSIVDVASSDDFSTLASLLSLADLVETLQEEGPFTVFAPTNAGKFTFVLLYFVLSRNLLPCPFRSDLHVDSLFCFPLCSQ